MRIAGTIQDSIVDGPGLRLTVFSQGCPHHCPGCHNPQTHNFAGGQEIEPATLIDMMRDNPLLDGLTLSGGEPFVQAEACAVLARGAHALGLNVWAYTGYTFEELLHNMTDDRRALLLEVDVLIDGRFELDQRSVDLLWRGSRNQRLLDARASLISGIPVDFIPVTQ